MSKSFEGLAEKYYHQKLSSDGSLTTHGYTDRYSESYKEGARMEPFYGESCYREANPGLSYSEARYNES